MRVIATTSFSAALIIPCLVTPWGVPRVVWAQGLAGLGPPGGLTAVDSKAVRVEDDLLQIINGLRTKKGKTPFGMDERLRRFSRNEAKMAAIGAPGASQTGQRIKAQKLAPVGHHFHFTYGSKAGAILKGMKKDAATRAALIGEFSRIGIGAFYVPDTKPYFQVALLLVRDPDPWGAKPGLSRQQTDPVMDQAAGRIKECYDNALKRNPNLIGNVSFQIVVAGDGSVSSAHFMKSLNAMEFDLCAIKVVETLRFPKPYKGKPVTLTHPMRFTPPHGDRRLGTLSETQIRGAFRKASYDFRKCYNAASKKTPKLKGTLTVALVVQPDGSHKGLKVVNDELGDKAMSRCVLTRIREVRFPRPKYGGEVDVTYPLVFEPAKGAP